MKILEPGAKQRIALRPLSTSSVLPDHSYLNTEASLVIGEEMSFTAVRVAEDNEYFELAWAFPEEISLLASITVGAHPEHGKVHLFPARWPIYIVDEGQDLSNEQVLQLARECLRSALTDEERSRTLNSWEELPPFLVSRQYTFNSNFRLSVNYQTVLLRSIDLKNHLMVRAYDPICRICRVQLGLARKGRRQIGNFREGFLNHLRRIECLWHDLRQRRSA